MAKLLQIVKNTPVVNKPTIVYILLLPCPSFLRSGLELALLIFPPLQNLKTNHWSKSERNLCDSCFYLCFSLGLELRPTLVLHVVP
jgi:hypothetical protein